MLSQQNLSSSYVYLFPNVLSAKSLDMEVLGFFSIYNLSGNFTNHEHFVSAPYRKVCIIRGIGYRSQLFENLVSESESSLQNIIFKNDSFSNLFSIASADYNSQNWVQLKKFEFPYFRYLSLRVGHSFHLYIPIPNFIGVKITKKDRKLIIYGFFKSQVANFTRYIYSFRPPSVYTGRGIRYKKVSPRRKLGKKDIRKGRFF